MDIIKSIVDGCVAGQYSVYFGRVCEVDAEDISRMPAAVLGWDPGVNGGISVLDARGHPIFVQPFRDRMTEIEACRVAWDASDALLKAGGWEAYCEKVHHMTGDGGQGSHTFGYIKGLVRGAFRTKGLILFDVPPQLWQAKLECLTGGDKRVSKARAVELFPGIKITHNVADSLLIALYGRLIRA